MNTLVAFSSLFVAVSAQLYPINPYWAQSFYNWNPYSINQPATYSYQQVSTPYSHYQTAPAASYGAYTPYFSPIQQRTSQYHAQDELGQYTYSYSGGPSTKTESKRFDGATVGSYSYIDANNEVQTVSYTADDVNGFRVHATNLPVAPRHSLQAPVYDGQASQPVQDTAEVAAAKQEFRRLFAEAAVAADAAPDTDGEDDGDSTPSAIMKALALYAPMPVQNTPEVAAAKIEFQQLYDDAAAAAAAAPEDAPLRRRRRNAVFLPALTKATYKTVSLDSVNEPTPADTTLLRLKEHQHETYVPAPVTYTAAVPVHHAVIAAPTNYSVNPVVQHPTTYSVNPVVQHPTTYSVNPVVQHPTTYSVNPVVQHPTTYSVNPVVQHPTTYSINPVVHARQQKPAELRHLAPTYAVGYRPFIYYYGQPLLNTHLNSAGLSFSLSNHHIYNHGPLSFLHKFS